MRGLYNNFLNNSFIRKINFKLVSKVLILLILIYFIYAFVFGVVIFKFHDYNSTGYRDEKKVDRFFGEEISKDKAFIVEDRYESALKRVNMIENSTESLDIAYYTIHRDSSADIFFGKILKAADRGVEVRIMLDGIFHKLRGRSKSVIYALEKHPNIELKFYEPLNIVKPWTFNNRLHDKFIIADNELAIIGGRNIGDKYFDKDYEGTIVNDRDVIIVNKNKEYKNSSIYEMEEYFNYVWGHEFTERAQKELTNRQKRKGKQTQEFLKDYINDLKTTKSDIFNNSFDWEYKAVPTKNITFIHNPIQRFNKEPRVWYDLLSLFEKSKNDVWIQSPYIIFTDNMIDDLCYEEIKQKNVNISTNSLASNPNYFATSGYLKYRKDIVDLNANLYEYQGPGSIHSKSFVFDDRISVIGSFNLDPRSAYLSTESMVVIDSEEFSEKLKAKFDNHIDSSLMVDSDYSYKEDSFVDKNEAPFYKKLSIRVLSIFTYFFDFML